MANLNKPLHSYMDFFLNSYTLETVAEQKVMAMKGTCISMCPEEEAVLRKRENMLHILEIVGSNEKLVKSYSRPAADKNLAVAHNLRPIHTLKETVGYLLFEVTKRKDVTSLVIYNFITDRLRAVRQDMIIQDLGPEHRVILLEPMIRFHIYYGYLLCESPIQDYSPTLNRNILLECLKICLFSYDELDQKSAAETHNISLLIDDMIKCSLIEKNQQLRRNRYLVEALYVLTNLYDGAPMLRLLSLSDDIRQAPNVRLAYRLGVAALHGHYVTVSKYISRLCPLAFCAVTLLLPALQRRALRVLSVAYSSRGRAVPLSAVRAWLALDNEEGARLLLRHYGLKESEGRVTCARSAFQDDAPLLPPRKISTEHLEGKMNIDYILMYKPSDI